ncbi:MAG TPA: LamG-like jellyroll fold domain-containing protein, partial [Candidatus Dormibacteraeota bacterium]|nr:LamG-like jellyroll fold domain-containing protein [Candidatus Dormibacteraeota bacterium]
LNKIYTSNRKAITGQLIITDVLPTSQSSGRAWKWNTNSSTGSFTWYATNFDDSAWISGQAGFGTTGTPGAVVRTTWKTPDIWIRQQFTLGALTPSDLNNLVFSCYHDEDCEIYLNGILAATATGYASSYVLLDLNANGQNALRTNAINLIAVHCHQTGGGQNIDVGISKRLLIADILSIPTDANGYWNLNETNGSVASDSSGNGNDGTVNNGAWSPSGKVGGCLLFNGSNSYARVSRAISNDFTISFWVKTTQTGGNAQWFQGQGLVDAETAGSGNDFGTALTGSKFAFGTGNPDTTIASVSSINDAQWHHCVATRQASTGTIKTYVDGVLEATGAAGTQALTTASFIRFGSLQTGVNFFNGTLDEIQIYNRALGGMEIAALYDSTAFLPPGPTNLTASAANGQVALAWSPVPGATSYNISRATTTGGPYTLLGSTTDTAFTNTNLVNGIRYYYVLSSINVQGAGPLSAEISAFPFNLAVWLRADAITGLVDGASVQLWPDLSGNAHDATQSTPALRPAYLRAGINGLPVVHFNGANSNYLAFPRPVQDDFTILCVFRSSQGVGTGTAFYQGAGLVNGEVPGVANDFGISLNTNGFLLAGTGNPDTTIVSSPGGLNDGQPHLLTFTRTESTGALSLYVDGALSGSANAGTQSLGSPNRLTLGCQQTLLFFLTGDIAEVKIFNSPLSSSARSAEENSLRQKYAIAVPALSVSSPGSNITLSWPDWAIAWHLSSTSNLAPPTVWAPITNAPQSIAGRATLTLPKSGSNLLFRLSSP